MNSHLPARMRRALQLTAVVAAIMGRPLVAQLPAASHGDSILVARDLDGDGRLDYVVREFRRLSSPARLETRIAVYLDGARGARRPTWAKGWFGDDDGEYRLEQSIALTKGVSLLAVALYGGDADQRTILLVRDGRARVDIEHQVDDGQGILTVGGEGEGVFIDASVRHLVLRGVEISSKAPCATSQWAMIHLRYDVRQRRFVPGRRYCASAR